MKELCSYAQPLLFTLWLKCKQNTQCNCSESCGFFQPTFITLTQVMYILNCVYGLKQKSVMKSQILTVHEVHKDLFYLSLLWGRLPTECLRVML